jgi:hypothetical protein
MVESVAHALSKKRYLQAATAQLWNRGRAAEQCNSVMHAQNACGAGRAVQFGQKARTLLAC